MPVKHRPLVPSESDSEDERNSGNGRNGRVPKPSKANSKVGNSSLNNGTNQHDHAKDNGLNGNAANMGNTLAPEGQETLKQNSEKKTESKYASYLYTGRKEEYDSEASGMLYRTDSNEDLGEEETEEQGLLGYIQGCFHPKIRKHWKTFVAAVALFVGGIAFLSAATVIALMPAQEDGSELHSYVFFICGLMCLIPGVYYVTYICRAAKGEKGYKMENIPTFSN